MKERPIIRSRRDYANTLMGIMPHYVCFALILMAASGLSGCAGQPISESNSYYEVIDTDTIGVSAFQEADYKILPGDEIQIKYLYHPEFNEILEVMPDGKIALPLIRGIKVAGKPPSQLAEELEQAYAIELKRPDIVVNVRRSSGRLVYVGGEVKNPQEINIKVPITLWQALIRSGGLLNTAELSNVLIVRKETGEKASILKVDFNRIRQGLAPDLFLQSYDVVHVPKTKIAEVGLFVDQYINSVIPEKIQFLFNYEVNEDF